jgi:GT2 family glycosyltransferase
MKTVDESKIYIIILNWNGWRDTIRCLESIFKLDYKNYTVIVCDNNSEDNSLSYIKEWANGLLNIDIEDVNLLLKKYLAPVVQKPINYIQLSREEIEEEKYRENNNTPLILIQTGDNLGYAGGNNIGLKYVLSIQDFSYVWILNNDTIVEKEALCSMVNFVSNKPKVGICGSLILNYYSPNKILAVGGAIFNTFLATSKHVGFNMEDNEINIEKFLSVDVSYIVGASMLVSKQFLLDVGLLCEEYFLYYEEVDWATRAKRKKYDITYCTNSRIYHKEGASTNLSQSRDLYNPIADYLTQRNALKITLKFYPKRIVFTYLRIFGVLLKSLSKKNLERTKILIKVLLFK